MRRLGLSFALLAGLAPSVAAQAPMPWTPEIGIRSTFGKVDIDGTKVTLIDIPGGAGFGGFGGGSTLYGVLPVGSRFAIEPGISLTDQTGLGNTATSLSISGRILFSAWRGLYFAAGPNVAVIKSDGMEATRWGGQVAGGYRFHVGGSVTGRAEVFYSALGTNDKFGFPKSNVFGLSLGLGMGLGESPMARAGRPHMARNDRMWDWAFGVQGGYSHLSFPGLLEITTLALPGDGNEFSVGGMPIPLPSLSPWFLQIPVGQRFAVEPSFGYHKFDFDGSTTGSSVTFGVRGDYAFNRAFYGALSAEMIKLGGDLGSGTDGMTGIGAAFGVRFPLVAGLKGRTELSYKTFTGGDNAYLPDHQVTSLSFGISAPIR